MNRSKLLFFGFFALLPIFGIALPRVLAQPIASAQIKNFLAALEGSWDGEAVITPVGPRPYDITFKRSAPRRVEGAAHPGASIHYWVFYEADQSLKLRFLSTFAGNRQPTFLQAINEADGTVVFRASDPHFLEVRVTVKTHTATIHIILRGEHHVEIQLERSSS
jgi:hypothetical protein